MPIEAKPLFRPDVLRSHLAGFELPAHVDELRPKLKRLGRPAGVGQGQRV